MAHGGEGKAADPLAALGERGAPLERAEHSGAAADEHPGQPNRADGQAGVFWALNGLRERVGPDAGAVLYTGIVPLPSGEEYSWQYGRGTADLLDGDWSELAPAIAALGHPV